MTNIALLNHSPVNQISTNETSNLRSRVAGDFLEIELEKAFLFPFQFVVMETNQGILDPVVGFLGGWGSEAEG